MTIDVYTCSDDFRVMDKTLNFVQTFAAVEIYGACSVSTPVLKLSNVGSQLPKFNYVYIPSFGRYYHVTDIEADSGGMVYVHCSVDVRYSFRNDIRNCPCIVLRNEGIGHPTMIVDPQLPIEQGRERIISKILPAAFVPPLSSEDEYTYILITR